MAIKLLIFDLGGVLTSSKSKRNPFKTIADKYKISEEDFQKIFYKYFEDYHFKRIISQYNFWNKTLQEVKKDISPTEIHKVIDEFNDNSVNEFNPEMIKLLQNLHDKYKLVLLSNSSREMDKGIFSSSVIRYFDRICLSHINSEKKPNKMAFLPILQDFNLDPEEVLFIDDKEKNLLGAKKLRINTILFKNYKELLSSLRDYNLL